MKRLMFILLATLVVFSAGAKRQKTGPGKLAREQSAEPVIVYDTIRPGMVRCSGYDKPNSATRETFFITNLDSVDIAGVGLVFEYSDTQGRQLHRVAHTILADIPAGQTRSLSVPSWDRNNAFHYFRSNAPQRRRSTPYQVTSRVDYVLRRR